MKIVNLKIKNFRNLISLDLNFKDGLTILYGDNGQGKTNIVESIYILAKTSSFRTNSQKELINFQNDEANLFARCVLKHRNIDCQINISKEGKTCFVNKIKLDKVSEYLGKLNAVCFSPDDVSLFKDSPSGRRQLMDRELSSLFPLYIKHLNIYLQYLQQRNNLLKQKEKIDYSLLDIINKGILQEAYEIYKGRKWLINKLENLMPNIYNKISGIKQEISIIYKPFIEENELEKYLVTGQKVFLNNLTKDLEKGYTISGIHREDFQILLNNKAIDSFGSQGQQRLMALVLKLSLAEIYNRASKEEPVIILDDVFSELDKDKQNNLMEYLKNKQQVFITCTEYKNIIETRNFNNLEVLKISKGNVVERGSI